MLKKYLTLVLTILIINFSFSTLAFADTKEEKESKLVEKIKIGVSKLGTGKDALVEVKLKDGTKVKGYIREITNDHFVVMDAKTGTEMPIPYPNAKQVKGNNLSTGVKIAIGAAIIFAVFVFIGLAQ